MMLILFGLCWSIWQVTYESLGWDYEHIPWHLFRSRNMTSRIMLWHMWNSMLCGDDILYVVNHAMMMLCMLRVSMLSCDESYMLKSHDVTIYAN